MAKKKATKKAPDLPKAEDAISVVVRWSNTFNCDRSSVQTLDLKVAAAIARNAGYEFMAHNHTVYLIHPTEAPEALGYGADALDAGLVVRMTADKKLLDVSAPDKKKYVVMAISYSYNDEWHYRDDGDSGRPETVFDTKQEAEVEAHKRDVRDRLDTDNPFEYLGEGNEEYDDCVSMPYYQWFDWLKDRDVEPPTESPDEKPIRDRLEGWWTEGVGGREWQPGGYQDVKGVWSDEQKRTAAEHIAVAFYEVVEVDYGQ